MFDLTFKQMESKRIEHVKTKTPEPTLHIVEGSPSQYLPSPDTPIEEMIQRDNVIDVSIFYNDMPSLEIVDDNYKYTDVKKQEVEIEVLRTYLDKNDYEDEGVDLARLYTDKSGQTWIRAKTSVSQELAYKLKVTNSKLYYWRFSKNIKIYSARKHLNDSLNHTDETTP